MRSAVLMSHRTHRRCPGALNPSTPCLAAKSAQTPAFPPGTQRFIAVESCNRRCKYSAQSRSFCRIAIHAALSKSIVELTPWRELGDCEGHIDRALRKFCISRTAGTHRRSQSNCGRRNPVNTPPESNAEPCKGHRFFTAQAKVLSPAIHCETLNFKRLGARPILYTMID